MCKPRPGPRCSDHPRRKVMKKLVAHEKAYEQLNYFKNKRDKLDTSDPNYETKLANIDNQISKAQQNIVNSDREIAYWEQEYESTPQGMRDIETKMLNPKLSRMERAKLEVDLEVAKMRRQWQLDFSKILLHTEEGVGGTEAAIKLAEFEKENIKVKENKLALDEVEAEKELNAAKKEYKKTKEAAKKTPKNVKAVDKTLNARQRLARAQKVMYRITKIWKLYESMTKDMDGFIKNRGRMLLRKTVLVGVAATASFLLDGKASTKVSTSVPDMIDKNSGKRALSTDPKAMMRRNNKARKQQGL
jgi:chromosome segregation ATPase